MSIVIETVSPLCESDCVDTISRLLMDSGDQEISTFNFQNRAACGVKTFAWVYNIALCMKLSVHVIS